MLETPSLDLGILASITRTKALAVADSAGFVVKEGRFTLGDLGGADEVFTMSTLKDITPVVAVGEQVFDPGDSTARLAKAFSAMVSEALK